MSIMLDIKMPDYCGACPMCFDVYAHCHICSALDDSPDMNDEDIFRQGRPEFCPLKEVNKAEFY